MRFQMLVHLRGTGSLHRTVTMHTILEVQCGRGRGRDTCSVTKQRFSNHILCFTGSCYLWTRDFPICTSNQLHICWTFSCPFLKLLNVSSHTASVVMKTIEMTTADNHTSALLSLLVRVHKLVSKYRPQTCYPT